MAIRDSQDLSVAVAKTTGAPRDSQDLSVAVAKTTGAPRDSQDLTLVLARATGAVRDSQDVMIVLAQSIVRGTVADSQASQTLAVTGSVHGVLTTQAPQTLDILGAATLPVIPDKPSIQVHPLVKPLDFLSRPLTQAGKRSTSFSTFLSEPGASRAFSMPLGARNQPIAGKVFAFTMGGTITPGTVGGSMVITPLYGATSDGVNLGSSAIQFYPASTNALPWRLKGEIIFQAVDLTPGSASVLCSGVFMMSGDPTVSDSNVNLLFGSANPIQVDLSAVGAVASGALNFAVSFGPSAFNVAAPVIATKYAFLRRF